MKTALTSLRTSSGALPVRSNKSSPPSLPATIVLVHGTQWMILDEPGKAEKKKKKLIILVFKLFTGRTNAYLVKRKAAGGVQFSRDPFNLTNENKRKVCEYS